MENLRAFFNEARGIAPQEPPAPAPAAPTLSAPAVYQQAVDLRRVSNAAARIAARDEIVEAQWNRDLDTYADLAEEVAAFNATRRRGGGLAAMRGGSLLVQITDVHFGGTVKGLEERKDANVYNLEVAAARLASYAEEVKFLGLVHAAEELVICLTGDIFDSKVGKCRLDKILHAEGTATSAYAHGAELIFQFIEDLRESELFGSIRVHGVAGNEARLYADRGHGHVSAADNWDSLLNREIASRYRGSDVETEFRVNRYVAEVAGWRVLLTHGDQALDAKMSQHKIQSLLGTHSADFGISGHIHDPYVCGNWSRSGSLIGTDAYAGDGLGLEGRACQSVSWLKPGRRNVYLVDLQTPLEGVEPYKLFDFAGAFGSADER